MVTIRLARGGYKKSPFYHVVVTDSRNKRDGRYIERVGFYNPVAKGREPGLRLQMDRIEHWRSVGAQVSERVAKLIANAPAEAETEEALAHGDAIPEGGDDQPETVAVAETAAS